MRKLLIALALLPVSANALLLEIETQARNHDTGDLMSFFAIVDTDEVFYDNSKVYGPESPVGGYADPDFSISVKRALLQVNGVDAYYSHQGRFYLGTDMMGPSFYEAWMGFVFDDWRYTSDDGRMYGEIPAALFESWDDQIAELMLYATLDPKIASMTFPDGERIRIGPQDSSYLRITKVPEPPALLLFGAGLVGLYVSSRRKSR